MINAKPPKILAVYKASIPKWNTTIRIIFNEIETKEETIVDNVYVLFKLNARDENCQYGAIVFTIANNKI